MGNTLGIKLELKFKQCCYSAVVAIIIVAVIGVIISNTKSLQSMVLDAIEMITPAVEWCQ